MESEHQYFRERHDGRGEKADMEAVCGRAAGNIPALISLETAAGGERRWREAQGRWESLKIHPLMLLS